MECACGLLQIVLEHIILYCIELYYIILYYITLYYIMLYYIILYYIMLYYIVIYDISLTCILYYVEITYLSLYIYIYIYICMYVYTHIHVYIYIYIYIQEHVFIASTAKTERHSGGNFALCFLLEIPLGGFPSQMKLYEQYRVPENNILRGSHLSNTTCLTHVLLNSGE